jgi:hypothetical protein
MRSCCKTLGHCPGSSKILSLLISLSFELYKYEVGLYPVLESMEMLGQYGQINKKTEISFY